MSTLAATSLVLALSLAGLPDVSAEALRWYAEGTPESADARLEAEAARLGDTLEGAQRTRHLSHVAEQQWRYPLALKLNARALALSERELGREHLAVADLLEDRARLLRISGRYPDAAAAAKRALTVRQARRGAKDPSLSPLLAEIAFTETMAGRFDEGDALARQAVDQAAVGDDLLAQASALNTQAALRQLRHDEVEAERHYREALDLYRRAHAERSAAAAATLNNLSLLLRADVLRGNQRRGAEAVTVSEEAVTAATASLGQRHPFTWQVLEQLAATYRDAGRGARALEVSERLRVAKGQGRRLCVNGQGIDGCLVDCTQENRCAAGQECIALEDVRSGSGPKTIAACFTRCEAVGRPGPDAGCLAGWECSPFRGAHQEAGVGVCAPAE